MSVRYFIDLTFQTFRRFTTVRYSTILVLFVYEFSSPQNISLSVSPEAHRSCFSLKLKCRGDTAEGLAPMGARQSVGFSGLVPYLRT